MIRQLRISVYIAIGLILSLNSFCQTRPVVLSDIALYLTQADSTPERELIDIHALIPDAVIDLRYAGTNNFTGEQIYDTNLAFLRFEVAIALQAVQQELKSRGYGIKVFDAYRPYAATLKFYEIVKDTHYVASPKYGSRHNRGCAVDLTIVDLRTGTELDMGTPFDEFSEKAGHAYTDFSKEVLQNRALLKDMMISHGFVLYPFEWWHYDFKGWEEYPLMDISLISLGKAKGRLK